VLTAPAPAPEQADDEAEEVGEVDAGEVELQVEGHEDDDDDDAAN
jgi:hypothetical protein